MAWYNSNWLYRQKITIDHTKVGASLTDFPVYLNLADLGNVFWAGVLSGGGDIRITTGDGSTEVAREVVSCDTTNKTGEVHFKAPSLSTTTDAVFYIYFGNSGASDYAVDATYGARAVWSNGYVGVFHYGNNINNSVSAITGTNHGSTEDTSIYKLGNSSRKFVRASSQYIDYGNPTALNINGVVPITVQAWVRFNAIPSAYRDFFGKGDTQYLLQGISSRFRAFIYDGDWKMANADADIVANTWYSVANVYAGTVGGNVNLYVNGAVQTEVGTADSINSSAYSVYAGQNSQVANRFFDGYLDECRISNVARSATWISTEYNNQNSPSTFYTKGVVEKFIEKALAYSVKKKIDTTKTLDYMVKSKVDVSRTLAYFVKKIRPTIMSLVYAVKVYPQITKGLAYLVKKTNTIDKVAEYRVKTILPLTKGLDYIVKSWAEITKGEIYRVLTQNEALQSLGYAVKAKAGSIIGIDYEVMAQAGLDRVLAYSVRKQGAVERGLTYAVLVYAPNSLILAYKVKMIGAESLACDYFVKTISGGSVGLDYEVLLFAESTKEIFYFVKIKRSAEIGLGYSVKFSSGGSLGVGYEILTAGAVNKVLAYCVKSPKKNVLDLDYRVKKILGGTLGIDYFVLAVEAINRALAYQVITQTTKTKGLKYFVRTESEKNKGVQYFVGKIYSKNPPIAYSVRVEREKTAGLAYFVKRKLEKTKALAYVLSFAGSISKGLVYRVRRKLSLLKGVDYEVRAELAITKGLVYRVKKIRAETKGLKYCVRITPEQKDLAVRYFVRKKIGITKGVDYEVVASPTIDKGIKYTVLVSRSGAIGVQYFVRTISAKDLELAYLVHPRIRLGMIYAVVAPVVILKNLDYVLEVNPYSDGDTPFTKECLAVDPVYSGESGRTPFPR